MTDIDVTCPKCGTDLTVEVDRDTPGTPGAAPGNTAARRIINLFGGVTKTSRILGLERTTVHRWDMPREKNGCGGDIPSKHHKRILREAHRLGLEVEKSDLINA